MEELNKTYNDFLEFASKSDFFPKDLGNGFYEFNGAIVDENYLKLFEEIIIEKTQL